MFPQPPEFRVSGARSISSPSSSLAVIVRRHPKKFTTGLLNQDRYLFFSHCHTLQWLPGLPGSWLRRCTRFYFWLRELLDSSWPHRHPVSSLVAQISKESACNASDRGLIPGSGRSPEEGNGNPFQYSCLENSRNRGAWQVTVQGVARIRHNLATKPPSCGHLGPGPPQLKSAAPRASQTCRRPQSSTRLAQAPHHCRTCGASKECPSEPPPPPNTPCQSPAEANSKLNIWIEWEGESSSSEGCFTQAIRRGPAQSTSMLGPAALESHEIAVRSAGRRSSLACPRAPQPASLIPFQPLNCPVKLQGGRPLRLCVQNLRPPPQKGKWPSPVYIPKTGWDSNSRLPWAVSSPSLAIEGFCLRMTVPSGNIWRHEG